MSYIFQRIFAKQLSHALMVEPVTQVISIPMVLCVFALTLILGLTVEKEVSDIYLFGMRGLYHHEVRR